MLDPVDLHPKRAEFPLSSGVPSAHASLGLHLATRTPPAPPARAYASLPHALEAHARGELALADTIRVDGATTTLGRTLVAACFPRAFRHLADQPWDALRGARLLGRIMRELHVEIAARAVAALELLGRYVADRSGFSLALDDFRPPAEVAALVAAAAAETAQINDSYATGEMTDGERVSVEHELWSLVAREARMDAGRRAPHPDPLAACAASDPTTRPPEELRSIRGVRQNGWKPVCGQTGTLADGFRCHEYFVACREARTDTCAAAWPPEADELFRDLIDAIGDVEIVAVDCGTPRGVQIRAIDHAAVRGAFALILEGRVTAGDVVTHTGELLAPANALIAPALARRIEAASIPSVMIRDVRTCGASGGVCARCFGLAPEDATWPCVGDHVGARAAEVIATAAGRRLPVAFLFHIC
jgi:DNA-directed RNA polymerase subunit beta'